VKNSLASIGIIVGVVFTVLGFIVTIVSIIASASGPCTDAYCVSRVRGLPKSAPLRERRPADPCGSLPARSSLRISPNAKSSFAPSPTDLPDAKSPQRISSCGPPPADLASASPPGARSPNSFPRFSPVPGERSCPPHLAMRSREPAAPRRGPTRSTAMTNG
jgi:hypothetical protein